MRLTKLLPLLMLLLAMTTARAQVGPGFIGSLDNTSHVLVALHPGDLTGFLDSFVFTVSGAGVAAAVIVPLSTLAPPDTDPSFFILNQARITGMVLIDATLTPLGIGVSTDLGMVLGANLPAAGTYSLLVAGTGGPGLGIYVGQITAQLVPEPQAVALLLAGLLLLLAVLRRRRARD